MECRDVAKIALDDLLGEASEADRRELASHFEGCAPCRRQSVLSTETWNLLEQDSGAEITPEFRRKTLLLLEEEMMRQRIRDFQPREFGKPQDPSSKARWFGGPLGPTQSRQRWSRLLAYAASLVLAAGAGFWSARRAAAPSAEPSKAGERSAQETRGLPDSNAEVSNVSYRPADGTGQIGVTFDVTQRRSITGRPDDPAVANLLAYLVSRGTQTPGEKSRAIEQVSSHYGIGEGPGNAMASPEIVAALTQTLRRDENPGVRKKAAEALAGFRMTPEIRTAFLDALSGDRNPAVRLVVVEALAAAAQKEPDQRTIESLRERAFDSGENGFVRAKAASALKSIEF